jgi:hypothetical protein
VRGEGSGEDDRLDIVDAWVTGNHAAGYHFILPALTAARTSCKGATSEFNALPASPRIFSPFIGKLFNQKVSQHIL